MACATRGHLRSRKFVVARRDPPTVFDFIEEPFDQIAGTVKVRAEADGFVAIASRWNVGPNAPFGSERSNPIGVIATVGEQHCSRLQARQKSACKPIVVRFTGSQREPHRKPIGIDDRMYLAGQPTS
jgi:hypothetical protein